MLLYLNQNSHLRYNALLGEQVLVCPNRIKRPWIGKTETEDCSVYLEYDVNNPLCPNNKRANGKINPDYKSTFVFENDFSALDDFQSTDSSEYEENEQNKQDLNNKFDFLKVQPAKGTCRVVCFHPKSNLTLSMMSIEEIVKVINLLVKQTLELQTNYDHIQIFENKGDIMGCSNPHPHGQIWASHFLPDEILKKDKNQLNYYQKFKKTLLNDYLKQELESKERIVLMNKDWVVLVPFWAYWPFETLILPSKRNIKRLSELNAEEIESLAEITKLLLVKYDNLFKCSFPYTMGWHGAPTGKYLNTNDDHWTLHALYYPPLLRSSKIKKFMAGYELLAMKQRDLTPEICAAKLREMGPIHYKIEEKKQR